MNPLVSLRGDVVTSVRRKSLWKAGYYKKATKQRNVITAFRQLRTNKNAIVQKTAFNSP